MKMGNDYYHFLTEEDMNLMIKSEEKALCIIKDLEKICSDVENLECLQRKDDNNLSIALCRILANLFWEVEYPIMITYPSLSSLAMIGTKYKNCTYKITQYHKNPVSYCVVKSGILPQNAQRIFAEMEHEFSEDPNLKFLLAIENCFPPEEIGDIINTIPSKIKAAFIIKESERICSEIELLVTSLRKDDKTLAEKLCKILGNFLFDIEGPTIRANPSVRPVVMLGEKYKDCNYNVVRYDKISDSHPVMQSGILPKDAKRVLSEIEQKFHKDPNSFFYLELEECEVFQKS